MFYNRLNKKEKGVYSIEEVKSIVGGQYNGRLNHGNVIESSIMIYTEPNMQGNIVESYSLSKHPKKSWVTNISINYSKDVDVYVNYETAGDIVDADDINFLQDKLQDFGLELGVYDDKIIVIESNLNKKADKTYVDTEMDKKYDKSETYTRLEVDERIEEIIGAAPEVLDTLQELAEALDNDPNFAATMTKELANKVDKEKGKGLSSNDFTNTLKDKLLSIQAGAEVNNPIIDSLNNQNTDASLSARQGMVLKGLIDSLETKINNLPVVDLTDIENNIREINSVLESLNIVEGVDLAAMLQAIKDLQENTATKNELNDAVTDLENQIKEIIQGDDSEFIIPRETNSPVANEMFYKQTVGTPPETNWSLSPATTDGWEIINQNHLKSKRTGYYNSVETLVSGSDGQISMKFVKENKSSGHLINIVRDGHRVVNITETRGDKEYLFDVETGDLIRILSAFDGDVFLEYIGEPEDFRLYVYKNGKEERIANTDLVNKKLSKYILRDEFESISGNTEDLTTKDKSNLVNAVNEVNEKIPTKLSQLQDNKTIESAAGIKSTDDRNVQETPSEKNTRHMTLDFKSISKIGNPPVQASGTYVYVLTISGYGSSTDISGGLPVQIALGKDKMAIRYGTDGTTWSNWELMAKYSDLSSKVDKVSGKGLSTNDYTTADKNKLAGISAGANKITKTSEIINDSGFLSNKKSVTWGDLMGGGI